MLSPIFPPVAGVSVRLLVTKRGIPPIVGGHGFDGRLSQRTIKNIPLIDTSRTSAKRLLIRAICSLPILMTENQLMVTEYEFVECDLDLANK